MQSPYRSQISVAILVALLGCGSSGDGAATPGANAVDSAALDAAAGDAAGDAAVGDAAAGDPAVDAAVGDATAVDAAVDAAVDVVADVAPAGPCGTAVGDVLCNADLRGYISLASSGKASDSPYLESFSIAQVMATATPKFAVVLLGAWW